MYALCASPAMILNRMNFGGVTYNRTNDVTLDGVASLGKTRKRGAFVGGGVIYLIFFSGKHVFFLCTKFSG
jgi:hypothetical protein